MPIVIARFILFIWLLHNPITAFHHRLTKRELLNVFGVEKHDQVPDYALIDPKHEFREGGGMKMSFEAWNDRFDLELTPNRRLVSPDLVSLIRDGNSSRPIDGFDRLNTSCHFLGRVTSHRNVSAAISSCGRLMGTLVMDDHFLVLQSLPQRIINSSTNTTKQHLIFKRSAALNAKLSGSIEEMNLFKSMSSVDDMVDQEESFCDVSKSIDPNNINITASSSSSSLNHGHGQGASTNLTQLNYSLPIEAKLDSLYIFPQLDPITLEIGLFLDSKLFEHFQREFPQDAHQHLVDFSLALINNVHVLYQQPTLSPNLDIVIVRYELWKSQPTGLETSVHRNGQAQSLLDGFCRHQARINPGSDLTDSGHWDHAVLLTGYDIYHTTTSVAGVAPVARMCDELFACSLVEGLHLGRSFVLAHEMGHNMGMVHDGVQNQCSRSCCLMSAVNGAGKTTWSTCSVREFNAFLLQLDESGRGNCLRDSAESHDHSHDHRKDGRLPGQRFTADQQCSYFWGRDYQVEIPNGRQMDDICRILWCGNSGTTISTAHPALEGSWCGNDKWCLEGQCSAWKEGTSPMRLDGGWSSWHSKEQNCPILSCQVTGSVQLKSQMRTCTNPAPNNGGRSCAGSPIRGLLCGEQLAKSNCIAATRQDYGNRLCSTIQNDPEKPDRQLSGTSFLHSTQPCKIWCHLIGSELIRNKGHFPDGSPCGTDHYCVGGMCLRLNCDEKAIVEQEADCPLDSLNVAKWSQWGEWQSCSQSCGGGNQKRARICNKKSTVNCIGPEDETQPCNIQPCPLYSLWGTWSECSEKCGGGEHERTRLCLIGACTDALKESKECNKNECPHWMEWEAWGSCSADCGDGHKQRTRKCTEHGRCDGEIRQACVEESWGDWLPCSVSCGSGFQFRERLCDGEICPNTAKQARTCNQEPCPEPQSSSIFHWGEWSDWLQCSETCGEGFQIRQRKCQSGSCPESEPRSEQRRCVLRPCPTWTGWNSWSACASCDEDQTRRRTRKCAIGLFLASQESSLEDAKDDCPGDSVEIESCSEVTDNCPSESSSQSSGIIRGVTTHTVSPHTAPPNIITADPSKTTVIDWDPWQEWQPCSSSCNGGIRHRTRTCPHVDQCSKMGLSFELNSCNEQKCTDSGGNNAWLEWNNWSACSVSCGGGMQTRRRTCAFLFRCRGLNAEERPCGNIQCPIVNTVFGQPVQFELPNWSTWSEWSTCSCFTMNKFRRRYCEIIDPNIQGFCSGPIIQQVTCTPNDCLSQNGAWSNWGEWSKCSKDCGSSGHQIRNRMCSNPVPANRGSYCVGYSFDQRLCEPLAHTCTGLAINGEWSDWTDWSTCSDPCVNGHKSRTRYCTNPRPANGGHACFGSDFELQSCSESSKCPQSIVHGGWGQWYRWSECSSSCGFSSKSRFRLCESPRPAGIGGRGCVGLAHMTSLCRTDLCSSNSIDGAWSQWTEWSNCTSNCGLGSRTRIRECTAPSPSSGGVPCFGRSSEVSDCQSENAMLLCSSAIANSRLIDSELNSLFFNNVK